MAIFNSYVKLPEGKGSSLDAVVLAGQVIGVRLLPQQLWAGDYGLEVPWAEHEDIVQKLIPWQFLLSHMCKRV